MLETYVKKCCSNTNLNDQKVVFVHIVIFLVILKQLKQIFIIIFPKILI